MHIAADQYAQSEEVHLFHAIIENDVKSRNNNMIPKNEDSHTSFGCQMKWLLWHSFIVDVHNPINAHDFCSYSNYDF